MRPSKLLMAIVYQDTVNNGILIITITITYVAFTVLPI